MTTHPPDARHVFVTGRVQGVTYRWSAADRARVLGLTGWVRNLDDGRVEAWLQGERTAVERALGWMAEGPPGAHVADLETHEVEPDPDCEAFEIRATP